MVKNLIERLRERKADGEQGSLILDILIGMAIFALIAFIAASAITQYRERAYEQGAVSDAGKFGLAIEAEFTDGFVYPADQAAVEALPVTLTQGNAVAGYTVDGAAETFEVCIVHESGGEPNAFAVYDSAQGGMSAKGRTADLASAPAVCGDLDG